MVRSWGQDFLAASREEFLNMTLDRTHGTNLGYLERSWVRDLPTEKNFELASATMILAHKPR